MTVKKLSLVKYAGEFWFTLADYAQTRDTHGYSDTASVKSAIRTFVVKSNPDKYIAFRGELQLKNIINENKNNSIFQSEDFQGTRTALIHWSMLEPLNERFNISKEYKVEFPKWVAQSVSFMEKENDKPEVAADVENPLESRSIVLRQLRQELARIDKSLEVLTRNKEKVLSAINAMESLEIEE